MIPNCVQRPDSTVASQALHLFNDGMIRKLSDAFAERVTREAGREPYKQVERAYQLALNRMPSDTEREVGLAAIEELTMARVIASSWSTAASMWLPRTTVSVSATSTAW